MSFILIVIYQITPCQGMFSDMSLESYGKKVIRASQPGC